MIYCCVLMKQQHIFRKVGKFTSTVNRHFLKTIISYTGKNVNIISKTLRILLDSHLKISHNRILYSHILSQWTKNNQIISMRYNLYAETATK